MGREADEIAGADAVLRVRQAGRIGKGRALQAELGGARRHAAGKGRLRLRPALARHALGEDQAGIIGEIDDHALEEIENRHLGFQRREHGGRARGRAAGAPGMFGDAIGRRFRDLATLQGIEGDFRRHQLGQRGRRQGLIGILRQQHGARLGIDHVQRLGLGLNAGGARCTGSDREGWQGRENGQTRQANQSPARQKKMG